MKIDPLSPSISRRICQHMNDDHHEALIQYAKRYGGIINPCKAQMIDLNPIAMTLEVDGEIIEIAFDHTLIDSLDAHRSLVSMIKETSENS